MQQKTRDLIEAWAKKAGFWKHATKEMFMQGNTPNMKIIDLAQEPPWIGISASAGQRIEAENSGIASIQDYKEIILKLYNKSENIKKPSEEQAASHNAAPEQEVGLNSPPILNETSVIPATTDGESHTEEKLPFICSKCTTPISAEQRAATVKAMGKALCEACIHKAAEEIAAKMQPKLEPKAPEPIKPVMCQDCGFELSHIRALEYQICEGCAEKRKIASEATVPLKPREAPKEKIMSEKTELKDIIPTGKPGTNAPAKKSDHEIDEMIERAKARKFAEGQGSSYKVSGKERPDSAMIQKIANECGISTEILLAEQTDTYSHVVTRGHLGATFVDAVVHHDFDIEFQLKTMEIIEKNPQILDHYEGITPVFKESAKVIKKTDKGEEQIDAKYYLVHALLSFKKFSLRDAATKSAAIVQLKLLNRDARDPEEIKSEQSERDLVEKQKRK